MVLVFGELHLHRILAAYSSYYNETRTHLGLAKDITNTSGGATIRNHQASPE
jgi:hypothetical protein